MPKKLHVKTIGSGTPLVMLPGWGWHSGIWAPIVEPLAQHFQLFLVDFPGYGESAFTADSYQIDEISQTLLASVPEQATWLGWSLGGMIAWWIASHYPQRVQRLVTLASSPKFVAEENWPGIPPQTIQKFKQQLVNHYQQTLRDFLDLQLRGSANRHELLQTLQPELTAAQTVPIEALIGGLDLLQSLDLRKDLSKIMCPSLYLFGSNDTLVPQRVVPLIQSLIPNGRCEVIPRAGHIPFLSHPEVFLKAILSS